MTEGWYVSLVRGRRVSLLAGPFEDRRDAEANVSSAWKKAEEIDPFCCFDAVGVCWRKPANKTGRLNDLLGVTA